MIASFGETVLEYLSANGSSRKDLAEWVGVSASTISRALGPDAHPPVELVQRITRALQEELSLTWFDMRTLAESYVFDTDQRRDMDQDAARVIAVTFPSLQTFHYWGQLVSGLDKAAIPNGGSLVLSQHNNSFEDFSARLTSFLAIRDLKGVICAPPYGQATITPVYTDMIQRRVDGFHERGIPIVFCDRYPSGSLGPNGLPVAKVRRVPYLGPNRSRIVEVCVRRLRELGHLRIGVLLDLPWVSAESEFMAYMVAALGSDYMPELVLTGGIRLAGDHERTRDPRKRIANARTLLEMPPDSRPTAIFCSTLGSALAAIEIARDLELEIPSDISIICLDSVHYFEGLAPSVTRVGYDMRPYAKFVMDAVFDLIKLEETSGAVSRKQLPASPKQMLFDDIKIYSSEFVGPPKQ